MKEQCIDFPSSFLSLSLSLFFFFFFFWGGGGDLSLAGHFVSLFPSDDKLLGKTVFIVSRARIATTAFRHGFSCLLFGKRVPLFSPLFDPLQPAWLTGRKISKLLICSFLLYFHSE